MQDLEPYYALLAQRCPPLLRTQLNDRTLWTWRRHWIDRLTVREVAAERGWSVPAVEWHLRRADRALRG